MPRRVVIVIGLEQDGVRDADPPIVVGRSKTMLNIDSRMQVTISGSVSS